MNPKKISHIGVLVHDAEAASKQWTESFGFQKFEDRTIDRRGHSQHLHLGRRRLG